jgi:hypothetical protein
MEALGGALVLVFCRGPAVATLKRRQPNAKGAKGLKR